MQCSNDHRVAEGGGAASFAITELLEICKNCKAYTSLEARTVAKKIFPGRPEEAYASLKVFPGPYNCFRNSAGSYERPLCVAVSSPFGIGYMEDGNGVPF